jgi:hypothetical protein
MICASAMGQAEAVGLGVLPVLAPQESEYTPP